MADLTPLVAFFVALCVSSVMSVGGLSGAFLLLPFQVSVLGFTGPAVTPTNHLFNVVAIPSGVYRYFREGRMLWPLAGVIAAGTVPGVVAGSLVRIYFLPDPHDFKLFMGCVLLLIGSRLAAKVLAFPAASRRNAARGAGVEEPRGRDTDIGRLAVSVERFDWQTLQYVFRGERYAVPVPALGLLSAVIGVIGGAYGIGGGAIMAPFLVSFWKLPVHTIAGATLLSTFLTSLVGAGFFWSLGELLGLPGVAPNLLLGLCFGAGGLIGVYAGARMQRFFPARLIEALLAVTVNGLGLYYIVGFFALGGR
jgi:uncharacterized membrane protein YfcA